ncbi:PQQ-dependent sugar dehydrogenase [Halohasta salina]|uniref:PQQ-dependent sugar dehydrogenase n=1 Tax=Halohasta salina TaxID=2961621 RepID=UPI0020A5BF5A|nr:PQQ-dependent sugar dehydrogenase [Halohasta salina]
MDRRSYLASVAAASCAVAGCLGSTADDPADPSGVAVEPVADGLSNPWGLAFLPDDGRLVVTERDARRVVLVDRETGDQTGVEGVPTVDAAGQGGLLDVAIHPEFPAEPWVYLTYSAANDAGESTTHLGRGRLDPAAARLSDFEVLHAAEPFLDRTNHYGSRVVFGDDRRLYLTVGDREFKDFGPEHVSQDLTNDLGSILRFEPDGSIPDDNPFVDSEELSSSGSRTQSGDSDERSSSGSRATPGDGDARDPIYSYGHRNPQGLAVHPETGALWESEHGERDGDELNVIEAGGNYGWPLATYACEYGTDRPVGDSPAEHEDLVPPVYYWECGTGGFPPAGMTFYDGPIDDWRGDLFVGNLAGEYLGRFSVDGTDVTEREPLLADRGWRLRAVATAPDTGHLYAAVDAPEAPVVRLVPE